MVDINYNKISELKDYLLRSNNHFKGAKFSNLMKELSNEEKNILFNDKDMIDRIFKIDDYDILAHIFRVVPGDIQEIMWGNIEIQKILLGIGKCSDEKLKELIVNKKFFNFQELAKKDKRGDFYYNPAKLRALKVLLRTVKSSKIIEQLSYNQYFQIILVCSKKVPDGFYKLIDVEKFFYAVVGSDFYNLVDLKTKTNWCQQVNNHCPSLLLPPDYKSLFEPTTSFSTYFYGETKRTLGMMISSKLYGLHNNGMKFLVDGASIGMLNLKEINILKSDSNGVVDQEAVNAELEKIVLKALEDGSIFSKEYLDTSNLDIKVQCSLFKIVVDKAMSNLEYENKILEYLYVNLFTGDYHELEKKALLLSLKNSIVLADEETLTNLFNQPNDLKSVFYLRFNLTARNMDYLQGISVSQLMRINVRHINRIVPLLYNAEVDELSDSYSKAIKLYLVFGLEKTLELLSGNYPVGKDFFDNVSKLNVSRIEMRAEGKKYVPIVHEEFNRFLFTANNIGALFDDTTAISSSWYYLFNNFETIKNLCRGHINLTQAETILKEQVNTVRYDLEPDCYRLEKILHEAGLGNKSHIDNEIIYDEICNIHKKQIRRVTSSIPYVKGSLENGWGYEVMRHDAAVAFVLGYRADCCIRTKDIAHNHLLHALLCENGRILLTYKPDGSIASFSPLKRNGELLIANSIEAIDKTQNAISPMVSAFTEGVKEICRVSKSTEEKGYLKVATIGTSSTRSPQGEHWPNSVPTPTILEKKHPVYKDTDQYHRSLKIFYKDDKANLHGLKYREVEQKYYDNRKPIIATLYDSRDGALLQYKVARMMESVRYVKWLDAGNSKDSFVKNGDRIRYFAAAFCNEDWYVAIDYAGGLHYECLDDDPRAKKEMDATIEVLNQYSKNREEIRKLVLRINENGAV